MKKLTLTTYTEYLDQCVKDLDHAKEYKTDQLAVELVRVQRLTERIFSFHNSETAMEERTHLADHSTMARLEAFRLELDRLRDASPANLKDNGIALRSSGFSVSVPC